MIGWQIVTKAPNSALEGNCEKRGIKPHIRAEAHERCVYCGIHENFIGGMNAFHKDHYRPKARFTELEHTLSNLYYACPICNIFKSDAWPNDPEDDHSVAAFPDPAIVDYNELFIVDSKLGTISGRFVDSAYIESQLYLNRPQLIMTRQEYALRLHVQEISNYAAKITTQLLRIDSQEAKDLISAYQNTFSRLQRLVNQGDAIPRYEAEDLQR